MRQSSVIFFFLFASFVIFITLKGELPVYLGLLLKSPAQTPAPGSSSGPSAATVAQAVQTLAPLVGG
jgi:hypothetical protein